MKPINKPINARLSRAFSRNTFAASLLILYVLFGPHAHSQAVLIKDINQSPDVIYPEYSEFVQASSTRLFFVSQGKELWATDGTSAGTIKYKALNAISDLTMVGTTLYFVGDSDTGGRELWKCTGPPPNISQVKQIAPGAAGSDPQELTNVNGVLYFIANGFQLWKSDGTSAGTVMVKDIGAGDAYTAPANLTNVNGILYFTANDNDHGHELWRSDGTASGTKIVKDINPGWDGSETEWLINMNGTLYFSAFHPDTGRDLWRSNGTSAGTVMVKDFNPGSTANIQLTEPAVMGNAMYFFAANGFWRSSGTSYGTILLKGGLSPEGDAQYGTTFSPAVIDGLLYFAASGSLWISNGTAAGTSAVTAMKSYSDPHFTAFNGAIYYFDYVFEEDEYTSYVRLMKIGSNGANAGEIWRTPTYMHDEEIPSYVPDMAIVNNFLLFDGIPKKGQGQKLLKLNAATDGVVVVKDVFPSTASGNPNTFVNHNGLVYFKSMDSSWQDRWVNRTDGTTAGTFSIATLEIVWDIFTAGNNVFFTGMDERGFQLTKTDGTAAGTLVVKEGDYATYAGAWYADLNGLLLFSNARGELWRSDGTVAGTQLMKTFSGRINQITSAGALAYILIDNAGQTELWRTNGKISGTVKIETLIPAAGLNPVYTFAGSSTVNGVTLFFGRDYFKGLEVWRTSGTSYGTYRLKEVIVNNPANRFISHVHPVTVFGNNVYFGMIDEQFQTGLYKSNGTAAGTVKIKNMNQIVQFIPLGDKLLLLPKRAAGTRYPEIWSSDGTAEGTKPFAAIDGEPDFYYFPLVEVIEDVAYFVNAERSLWRTDGTACGTFQIQTGLASMTAMESLDNNLIFGGFAGYRYGNELYRFNLSNVPAIPCVTMASEEVAEALLNTDVVLSAPNPFETDFTLRINGAKETPTQVRVFSSSGTVVETLHSDPNIDYQLGKNWSPGLYLIQVRVGGAIITRKIIKK